MQRQIESVLISFMYFSCCFHNHDIFLCIDELGELTYFVSGAKDRVLQKQIFSVEYYLSLRSVEIVPKKFDLSVKTRNYFCARNKSAHPTFQSRMVE